jgi:hypothetical protein
MPAISALVNISGEKIEVPDTVLRRLVRIVEVLAHGTGTHLIPSRRVVTTRRAAWIFWNGPAATRGASGSKVATRARCWIVHRPVRIICIGKPSVLHERALDWAKCLLRLCPIALGASLRRLE